MTRASAPRKNRVLVVIAILKFCKALLFIAFGLAAFELLRRSFADRVQAWIVDLPFQMEQRLAENGLKRIFRLGPGGIRAAGVGAFLYAGVFLTEGIGLLKERRWAEWLTVIVTASLIPFEVYECIKHTTILRVAALVLNLAIVGYLIQQLRQRPE